MSILYVLVPIALILVGAAVAGFVWAVRHGQFDDVHTPAIRMLLDDEDAPALPPERPGVTSHASHEEAHPARGAENHHDSHGDDEHPQNAVDRPSAGRGERGGAERDEG